MKDLHNLNIYRDYSKIVVQMFGSVGDSRNGVFHVKSPINNALLKILASSDEGWDHISVSRQNRCPNWPEMEHIARLFFRGDETAMQLHVPPSDHINCHPYCLHWWRPHVLKIPRPPAWMVGPASTITKGERQ